MAEYIWHIDVFKIREEFKSILFNGIVCEQQAKQIVNTIKGRINRKDNMVEEMYHQSVLARNLLAAQFLGCAIIAFLILRLLDLGTFLYQLPSSVSSSKNGEG